MKENEGLIGGLLSIAAGLGVVGLQVFWFLRDGIWTPLSIVGVLQLTIADVENPNAMQAWIMAPGSWTGLHMTMDWLPVSGVLFAMGMLAVVGSE